PRYFFSQVKNTSHNDIRPKLHDAIISQPRTTSIQGHFLDHIEKTRQQRKEKLDKRKEIDSIV
ncbi:MAG: hypothetical protein J6S67_06225, partial [Methanobrevibacter sp.]|nr:hypothetical protein [Methanobrevibacter sp.]